MKLEMYPIQVAVNEHDEVELRQPDGSGQMQIIKLTVEQVPFVADLLTQARYHVEELRKQRTAESLD